jgi:hypothetical protein
VGKKTRASQLLLLLVLLLLTVGVVLPPRIDASLPYGFHSAGS